MYRVVKTQAQSQKNGAINAAHRVWAVLAVLSGVLILATGMVLSRPQFSSLKTTNFIKQSSTPKPKAPQSTTPSVMSGAFLSAMNEDHPALQRARLIDFQNSYPDNAHTASVKSKLKVLQSQEADDWAVVSEYLFNPDVTKSDKFSILNQYEKLWDPVLLGGRNVDLEALKADISAAPDVPPNRALTFNTLDNPHSNGTDWLAGDNYVPLRTYVQPTPSYTSTPRYAETTKRYTSQTTSVGSVKTYPARRTVTPSSHYSGTHAAPSYSPTVTTPTASISLPRASLDTRAPQVQIINATIKKNRSPKYPDKALERGIEGWVVMELTVNAKGRVKEATVINSVFPEFEKQFIRSAKKAALRTRYNPRTVDGEAVASKVEKTYRFKVDQ